MSEFEDELLELAGATDKKRKRRQHSSGSGAGGAGGPPYGKSKKRRAERMDSDSERSVESEEEMSDPYPLEGKYRDEADKRELMAMSELQREEILEQRAHSRGQVQNARKLADFRLQQQKGGAVPEDAVSKAAKRQHMARGATKEKSSKLDELKAKRKAKDDKKRSNGGASPSQRERSSSPQDMDISDSDSEDGQVSKSDQEDMRINNLTSGGDYRRSRGKEDSGSSECTIGDLEACRVSRDAIAKHCLMPWFPDYILGSWVRYLIGTEHGANIYRACQVIELVPNNKVYKVNETVTDDAFELQIGKSTKTWPMDRVSNAPFTDREFDRLISTCKGDHVPVPTKSQLEKKSAQMKKLIAQPLTDSDINAMIARKKQLAKRLNPDPTPGLSMVERSSLTQQRTLAIRRQDYAEVTRIDGLLGQAAQNSPEKVERLDPLARVNAKNRKANLDSARMAESKESKQRKLERKLAAQNPDAVKPVDPSARLKIAPRVFAASTPTTTRPGTPVVNGTTGTSTPVKSPLAGVSPPKAPASASTFEASIINSIDIDLGDF